MAIYNKPDESVFASNAKQGEVNNFPDIGRGWGVSFDQTGGIPPMEWFNFLLKEQTRSLVIYSSVDCLNGQRLKNIQSERWFNTKI